MAKKKRLTRGKDKVLGGVCSGIAEYLGTDATAVRIVWVLLSILTALVPGMIAYLICWLLIPER